MAGAVVGRGRHVEITTDTPTADLAHLTGWAADRGIELDELTVSTPSLEDVYLSLVADDADEQDDEGAGSGDAESVGGDGGRDGGGGDGGR